MLKPSTPSSSHDSSSGSEETNDYYPRIGKWLILLTIIIWILVSTSIFPDGSEVTLWSVEFFNLAYIYIYKYKWVVHCFTDKQFNDILYLYNASSAKKKCCSWHIFWQFLYRISVPETILAGKHTRPHFALCPKCWRHLN